jgi:hypothetical protein
VLYATSTQMMVVTGAAHNPRHAYINS